MQRPGWIVFGFSAVVVAAVGATLVLAPPTRKAEAQPAAPFFSYAVKFVCGFNRSNLGFPVIGGGAMTGEAVAKIGNYATEINIYNPQRADVNIQKLVHILARGDAAGNLVPVGREPVTVAPSGGEAIILPTFQATMDDCNKIYALAGVPLVVPPTPLVGFLVVQSSRPIDVTGVYTAELCSDWKLGAPPATCTVAGGQNYGVSLSIDVEQINGKQID